ncbi:unnamed protein product [Prorocentrum cordatum]|uniref:Uncharacterized protein n=1 Tax=Prorocentrum cordatum TaxID=2364126 RepID=A0ABN9SD27_9DINO|nr:unnamed protein product [Polarella glacialis]
MLEENAGSMARNAVTLDDEDAAEGPLSAVAWAVALAFPTKGDSGWGWQHQRWSWPAWWDFVGRCLQGFTPGHAFRVLCIMLECMVKQDGGTLIHDMPTWKEDPRRLQELRRRLCKTGGLSGLEELLERLPHLGVD